MRCCDKAAVDEGFFWVLFLRHTSASLRMHENADPDVQLGLCNFFSLGAAVDPLCRWVDLSRICAAPNACLSYLSFKIDRVFQPSAECA